MKSTPLMVGGTLYTSTSLSQVAAIDCRVRRNQMGGSTRKSTRTVSAFPPTTAGLHRGVGYWRSGDDETHHHAHGVLRR